MFCKQIKGDCDKKEIIVLRFGWGLSLSSHYSSLLYRVKIPSSVSICVYGRSDTPWKTQKANQDHIRNDNILDALDRGEKIIKKICILVCAEL